MKWRFGFLTVCSLSNVHARDEAGPSWLVEHSWLPHHTGLLLHCKAVLSQGDKTLLPPYELDGCMFLGQTWSTMSPLRRTMARGTAVWRDVSRTAAELWRSSRRTWRMRWCPGPSVGRWSLESRVQLQTPSSCSRDLGEVVAIMNIIWTSLTRPSTSAVATPT